MSVKILIAGDIVPTESNYKYFISGNKEELIGQELCGLFEKADFIAMNLETPLCDELDPILKAGPCLHSPCTTIKGIKSINPYFFTLANNHIMDQGLQGLDSTCEMLNRNGIAYAGAGKNIEEARKAYVAEICGKRVGFYCCTEHEFSIADDKLPGANPYDPLESFEHVKALKQKTDYAIVLYHGGKEEYRYPSPKLQKVFHKFADSGADLVVAQHTHCVGCDEKYKNSTLIYGQGNFLFDLSNSEYWNTSIVVEIEFDKAEIKVSYIPIVKKGYKIRLANKGEAAEIIGGFNTRSDCIKNSDFIKEQYRKCAIAMEKEYLIRLHGKRARNYLVRLMNKLTGYRYIASLYPNEIRPIVRNVIECEAHNELTIEVMKIKTHEKRRN